MAHLSRALIWRTHLAHSSGTLIWYIHLYTQLAHSSSTPIRHTHLVYSSGTFIWRTYLGHSSGTLNWYTHLAHSSGTLNWYTHLAHSPGALMWYSLGQLVLQDRVNIYSIIKILNEPSRFILNWFWVHDLWLWRSRSKKIQCDRETPQYWLVYLAARTKSLYRIVFEISVLLYINNLNFKLATKNSNMADRQTEHTPNAH